MKSILLSIKPQYVAKILNGEKTIEIRKHAIPVGTKVYVYCTKLIKHKLYTNDKYVDWNGKVVASFVVSKCEKIHFHNNTENTNTGICLLPTTFETDTLAQHEVITKACLTYQLVGKYCSNCKGFAWHVSQLNIFDRPKELKEFYTYKPCQKCCINPYKKSCSECNERFIKKAPQSYCYVEELK